LGLNFTCFLEEIAFISISVSIFKFVTSSFLSFSDYFLDCFYQNPIVSLMKSGVLCVKRVL